MARQYKLVVCVPVSDADKIRDLLGKIGAGQASNYDYTSFSVRGIGRFRPLAGAKPAIGEVGKLEEVEEDRIETVVGEEDLDWVLEKLREAHPYEEPVIDVYPLLISPFPPAAGGGESGGGFLPHAKGEKERG